MAGEAPKELIGSWKLTNWVLQVVGSTESKPPYGDNPKGRLIVTPQGDFMVIISGANRHPAKTVEEKAALLDSVLAYAGKSTFEGNRITTTVDMSANEVFSGDKARQMRFFEVKGDRLTIKTPEIASAVLPGKKTIGILEWVRE
ncbi:MAG: lipocalin-like domain-containing protein [Pseudolabrys sp.]